MRARARIAAVAVGSGGTRLAVLHGEPPLLLRRTGPPGGVAEVHLVGGAAGPLGGDRLSLRVDVGPGAALVVRAVAASIALPDRAGAESRVEVTASVASGGRLTWLPGPLIAATGCRHAAVTTVDVADGGWLCWREELVCGRHGEQPGDARLTGVVRLGGRTLYRQDLAIGPAAPGWDGPAVLGDARATGAVLVINPAESPQAVPGAALPAAAVLGPTAALMPLAGPGMLATATGVDLRQVRERLDPVVRWAMSERSPASDRNPVPSLSG
jgi:urease accessory protein